MGEVPGRPGSALGHGVGSDDTGVQLKRPTVFQLEENMRRLTMPTLLMVGDEDEPYIEPMLFMKQCIPGSGLAMFPRSGHAINLEEPALFNSTVLDFLTAVEALPQALRSAGGILPGLWSKSHTQHYSAPATPVSHQPPGESDCLSPR